MMAAPRPHEEPAYAERETRALRLWVVLSRAHSAVQALTDADIARHGFTTAEFGILEALYHKGPLLLGDLQRRVLVSSGGITYLVDKLTERGLIKRRPSPDDRRARYAELTRKGHALVRSIFPAHAAAVAQAFEALSPAEQDEAHTLLRALGLAVAARQVPKLAATT